MIVYLDNIAWTQELSTIPTALQARHFQKLEQAWADEFHISISTVEPLVVRADISRAHRQNVFHWLGAAKAACVDIEPSDIRVLLNDGEKTLTGLAVLDLLQNDTTAQQMVSQIPVPEIMDVLLEQLVPRAAFPAESNDPTRTAVDDEVAAARMREAGFAVPATAKITVNESRPGDSVTDEQLAAYGFNQPKELDAFDRAENPEYVGTGTW